MGFASSPTRLAALDPLAGLLEKARIRDSRHLKKDEATLCLEGYENFCALLCETCVLCQQAKPGRTRLPGLLQPLPVSTAWQIISLDFVEGLPRAQSANCILVVVDSFTKYGHFISLSHPFTAAGVAKLFMNHIYKLHGMLSVIVSDRDRVFTSQLWRELFRLARVELHMSSSYHPQSDGQTERLNQTMETFLRCFVNACPSKWVHWSPTAESGITIATIKLLGCLHLWLYMGILLVNLASQKGIRWAVPDLSE